MKITAEVVGAGTCKYCKYDASGFYIKLTVKNVSPAARTFAIMDCSWQRAWAINAQGLSLGPQECQHNMPEEIELAPGQQLNFFGFLQMEKFIASASLADRYRIMASYSAVRFAFTESSFDSMFPLLSPAEKEPGTTYWSNPVSLIAAGNFYRMHPALLPPWPGEIAASFYKVQPLPAQ